MHHPSCRSYGHVELYEDRLLLSGVDTMMTMSLPFLTKGYMDQISREIEAMEAR